MQNGFLGQGKRKEIIMKNKSNRQAVYKKYINSELGKATRKAWVKSKRGKEIMGLASKKYHILHKSEIKERSKLWRSNHREEVKKRKREWARSPSGRLQARKYWKKSTKAMFHLYENVSKRKNLKFSISFEDFNKLIFLPCNYCGHKPTPPERNGLDRMDNTKGYELSNVVPCCTPCNQMKSKLTVKDFVCKCREIIKHMEKNHVAQKS